MIFRTYNKIQCSYLYPDNFCCTCHLTCLIHENSRIIHLSVVRMCAHSFIATLRHGDVTMYGLIITGPLQGEPPVTGGVVGVYFVFSLSKLLNKYWNCWWFETPRSRHDNALISMGIPAKHFLINVVKQLTNRTNASRVLMPISPQRTHETIITLLVRQNDVAISFWRNNDFIITSRVHLGSASWCPEVLYEIQHEDNYVKTVNRVLIILLLQCVLTNILPCLPHMNLNCF